MKEKNVSYIRLSWFESGGRAYIFNYDEKDAVEFYKVMKRLARKGMKYYVNVCTCKMIVD